MLTVGNVPQHGQYPFGLTVHEEQNLTHQSPFPFIFCTCPVPLMREHRTQGRKQECCTAENRESKKVHREGEMQMRVKSSKKIVPIKSFGESRDVCIAIWKRQLVTFSFLIFPE